MGILHAICCAASRNSTPHPAPCTTVLLYTLTDQPRHHCARSAVAAGLAAACWPTEADAWRREERRGDESVIGAAVQAQSTSTARAAHTLAAVGAAPAWRISCMLTCRHLPGTLPRAVGSRRRHHRHPAPAPRDHTGLLCSCSGPAQPSGTGQNTFSMGWIHLHFLASLDSTVLNPSSI